MSQWESGFSGCPLEGFDGCPCGGIPLSQKTRRLLAPLFRAWLLTHRTAVEVTLISRYLMRIYMMRMPGVAPLSGERTKISLPPGPAAITIPSLMPNFILRGARLATITTKRPSSCSGL